MPPSTLSGGWLGYGCRGVDSTAGCATASYGKRNLSDEHTGYEAGTCARIGRKRVRVAKHSTRIISPTSDEEQ